MITDTPRPEKTPAVQSLLETCARLCVFPGHEYSLSLGEQAVLETRPVQRMARLRQIGLGFLVLPTAEHTRLAHSLGTAYWASRFLEAFHTNHFADRVGDGQPPNGNRSRLAAMDSLLGPTLSLDLLVRLFALIHDMSLLPLGHTLQFQCGYFTGPGSGPRRARFCLARLREQLREAPALAQLHGTSQCEQVTECLLRHLDVVECVFGVDAIVRSRSWGTTAPWISPEQVARWLPALTFIHDLIAGTVSADLVDFSLRDSLGAGIPRSFDATLLDSLCVFAVPPPGGAAGLVYRFGFQAVRDTFRQDVITGVVSLLRARYELAERVFYHDDKCVADAMLDRVLRLIDAQSGTISRAAGPFEEPALLQMGDDDLLALLERKEQEARQEGAVTGGPAIMSDLLSRRLYGEVFRVSQLSALSPAGCRVVDQAHQPQVRTEVEQQIHKQVAGLAAPDLIFACRSLSMQAKAADTLIGWDNGTPRPLCELAQVTGYGAEALEITKCYADLWSLSVYLRPQAMDFTDQVRAVCRAMFTDP